MMVEEPDSENSLFSEPMKMRTPSALLGAAKQIDHAAVGLEIVEQQPHPLQIVERLADPRADWRGRARSACASSLSPPDQLARPAAIDLCVS